jgi:hypothetical protein
MRAGLRRTGPSTVVAPPSLLTGCRPCLIFSPGIAPLAKGNAAAKYATARPYADPETAARRIIEIANTIEPVQDGRIYIEKINAPFLYRDRGTPAEYSAG